MEDNVAKGERKKQRPYNKTASSRSIRRVERVKRVAWRRRRGLVMVEVAKRIRAGRRGRVSVALLVDPQAAVFARAQCQRLRTHAR